MDILPLIIKSESSVLCAMKQLSDTACKILLLCEEERFTGIITDGDIRRFILCGGNLSQSCTLAANISPKTVTPQNRSVARDIMDKFDISAVPVVDIDGRPIDLILSRADDGYTVSKKIDLPVIVMAGGLGTRLHPYTKILPKPLIPIGELPIAQHITERFAGAGCNKFYLIVNHKKNMIKSYFAELCTPYEIHFIDETLPLGTAGGLSLLKGKINETFFITNCDILIKADYESIHSFHKKNGNTITVTAAFKHIVIPYGVIELTPEGEILSFSEKPQIDVLTNTGFYLCEPCVINDMPENQKVDMPDIIEKYRKCGQRVGVYPIGENGFMDMGRLEELQEMQRSMYSDTPQ